MDERILSDEEIKELFAEAKEENNTSVLSQKEIDALGEIGNISIGTSATTLYSLLNNKVLITTPSVKVTSLRKLKEVYPIPFIAVEVHYTKGINGSNLMIIKEKDAKVIADLMMGGDGSNVDVELDELRLSAVGEAMNQMMGSAATSLSTMLKKDINISPPKLNKINFAEDTFDSYFEDDLDIVVISFNMEVGDILKTEFMQLMPVDFAKNLVSYIFNISTNSIPDESSSNISDESRKTDEQEVKTESVKQDELKQPIVQTPEQNETEHTAKVISQSEDTVENKVNIRPVQFENFAKEQATQDNLNLNLIKDVPLKVSVELGRTKKTLKEILELGHGAIIELNKMAGEPVDILVNGKFIAKGEVVVVDENFGVRITEIINSTERVESLQ